MTYKVIGLSKETGQAVEVFVFRAISANEASDVAKAHGIHPGKVGPIFNAFVPPDAQRLYAKPDRYISGERASLEAIANCALVQRPIRTLVVAVVVGILIGGFLWFLIGAALSQ